VGANNDHIPKRVVRLGKHLAAQSTRPHTAKTKPTTSWSPSGVRQNNAVCLPFCWARHEEGAGAGLKKRQTTLLVFPVPGTRKCRKPEVLVCRCCARSCSICDEVHSKDAGVRIATATTEVACAGVTWGPITIMTWKATSTTPPTPSTTRPRVD
jgi:hypothetical protein